MEAGHSLDGAVLESGGTLPSKLGPVLQTASSLSFRPVAESKKPINTNQNTLVNATSYGDQPCGSPPLLIIFSRGIIDITEKVYMTGISSHLQSLQLAIQFAEDSHRTNGQNLANINTPNYKSQEVPFSQLLAQLENPREVQANAHFEPQQTQGLQDRKDGNNIDLDRELALLKKNSLAFQTLTQLLGSKMGILERAITN